MPSLGHGHEALVRLFRNRPQLAPELLAEALGVSVPTYTEARVDSAELTETVPAEYRADLVVLLVHGVPVFGVTTEVAAAADLSRDDVHSTTERLRQLGLHCSACRRSSRLLMECAEPVSFRGDDGLRKSPAGIARRLSV